MASLLMLCALASVTPEIRDYVQILKELQGTWSIEYAEHRGERLATITESKIKLKDLQIKFDQQRISVRFNNEWLPKEAEVRYVIDVSKSKMKSVVNFGISIPFISNIGIYRISNDEMTACFAAFGLHDDKGPPNRFATSKDDHFYLFKLKRVK